TNQSWCKVATGNISSAGIATDGSLWVWGSRSGPLLGMREGEEALIPARMSKSSNWVDLAASSSFFSARDARGNLAMWGAILFTVTTNQVNSADEPFVWIDHPGTWKSVIPGLTSVFAIDTNAQTWRWGPSVHAWDTPDPIPSLLGTPRQLDPSST